MVELTPKTLHTKKNIYDLKPIQSKYRIGISMCQITRSESIMIKQNQGEVKMQTKLRKQKDIQHTQTQYKHSKKYKRMRIYKTKQVMSISLSLNSYNK